MHLPDWRQPQNYSYTESLSVEQWAWGFLRRNRGYQQDWQRFWATNALSQHVTGNQLSAIFSAGREILMSTGWRLSGNVADSGLGP